MHLERVLEEVVTGREIEIVNELDLLRPLACSVGIVPYLGLQIVAYGKGCGRTLAL